MANIRTLVAYTVPVITAFFGLLWYFGRKKTPPDKPPLDQSAQNIQTTTSDEEVLENHSVSSSAQEECSERTKWTDNLSFNANSDVSEKEPLCMLGQDSNLEVSENHSVSPSAQEKCSETTEWTDNLSFNANSDISVKEPYGQVSTDRMEEIVTVVRSSVVASPLDPERKKLKIGELSLGEEMPKSVIDENDHDIEIESCIKPVSVEKISFSENKFFEDDISTDISTKIESEKSTTDTSKEDEENYRDSLNLDEDYDYRSYSKNENADNTIDVCDKEDTDLGFNEAFIVSGETSENITNSKSEVVSDLFSENMDRTTGGNTSMSTSVLEQPLMENSVMGQPLLESSTIVTSLLESSVVGQPLLESTKLDTTSSASKDTDCQTVCDHINVSDSSELKIKSDSSINSDESKKSWAELSMCCEEQSPTCKNSEGLTQLNISVSKDVLSTVDSEHNCSKNDSRHLKDFSPESHHRSGNDLDNGVTSSESNCDSASVDSGKGASIHDVPPVVGNHQDVPQATTSNQSYQCNFPTNICGRLIGRQGKNINLIKDRSGANISLNTNPFTPDYQLCTIEGTKKQIDEALREISHKFPEVDLSPINMSLPSNGAASQGPGHPVLMPEIMQVISEDMQLNLPEGVSVDVVVSSIVDAGHIFIQQHTHPSFPSLERLNQFMMACYTTDGIVPQLPRPIEVGVICAAPMLNGWYRAQISCVYEDSDECDIKFVDYGGFTRVQACALRQIRSDFMTLPFQATECYMANVTPLQDEEYFSAEASATLELLTQGKLLQAQVVGRTEDGIPYVHVYQISGDNKVIFVNRELVNRGLTRWIEVLS